MFQVNQLQGANIQLGIIDPHSLDMLGVLAEMIQIGSQDQVLATADLRIKLLNNETHNNDLSIQDLMSRQNPYIDSVIYKSIQINRRGDIAIEPINNTLQHDQLQLMYRNASIGAFVAYFYLLSQGKWPTAQEQQIPRFLIQTLHLNNGITTQINSLYRLQPQSLPVQWIRNVQFGQLNTKSKNRLSMGAAGHRLLFALYYTQRNNNQPLTPLEARAINYIRQYLDRGICWEFHPLFRPPIFFTRFVGINDDILFLIQRQFNQATLERMVQQKVLFAMPQPNLQKIRFQNWPDDPFDFCINRIFQNDQQQNIPQQDQGGNGGQGPPNQGQGGNQQGPGGNQDNQGGNDNQQGGNDQGGGGRIQQVVQQQQQEGVRQQQLQNPQDQQIMNQQQNSNQLGVQGENYEREIRILHNQRTRQQQAHSQSLQNLQNNQQILSQGYQQQLTQGQIQQQQQQQTSSRQSSQDQNDQRIQNRTNLRPNNQGPLQPKLLFQIKYPQPSSITQISGNTMTEIQMDQPQQQIGILRLNQGPNQSQENIQLCGGNHNQEVYCAECNQIEMYNIYHGEQEQGDLAQTQQQQAFTRIRQYQDKNW